jgi:hypothetical protein
MNGSRWLITTIICVLASFFGGVFSSQFFQTSDALANKSQNLKVVEANEFRVIDSDGKVKATFGISKSSKLPSLRLLTKAYGGNSGILLESSDSSSMIQIFGENAGISMNVHSLDETGFATFKVKACPLPDLLSEKPFQRDDSRIELTSGVGSPTRLAFFDKADNHRAIFGNITLEEPNTGVTEEYPISLVLLDKKGKVTWKAP